MVQSDVKLTGKTTIITGCNTGIGLITAIDFARRGARVIMACRNVEKAEEAKAEVGYNPPTQLCLNLKAHLHHFYFRLSVC